MRIAVFNAILGTALVFFAGTRILGLSPGDLALCILATQLGAWAALFGVLGLEKIPYLKAHYFNHMGKTWALFLSLYFGVSLGLAAPLREARVLGWLVFPLMLTTGFAIIIFGPIQDWMVRLGQRRAAFMSARKKDF